MIEPLEKLSLPSELSLWSKDLDMVNHSVGLEVGSLDWQVVDVDIW